MNKFMNNFMVLALLGSSAEALHEKSVEARDTKIIYEQNQPDALRLEAEAALYVWYNPFTWFKAADAASDVSKIGKAADVAGDISKVGKAADVAGDTASIAKIGEKAGEAIDFTKALEKIADPATRAKAADQLAQLKAAAAAKGVVAVEVAEGLAKSSAQVEKEIANSLFAIAKTSGKDVSSIATDLGDVARLSGRNAVDILADVEKAAQWSLRMDPAEALKRINLFYKNGGSVLLEIPGFQTILKDSAYMEGNYGVLLNALDRLAGADSMFGIGKKAVKQLSDSDMAGAVVKLIQYTTKEGKGLEAAEQAKEFLQLAGRASVSELQQIMGKLDTYGPENYSVLIKHFNFGDIPNAIKNPPHGDSTFRTPGTLFNFEGVWKTPAPKIIELKAADLLKASEAASGL